MKTSTSCGWYSVLFVSSAKSDAMDMNVFGRLTFVGG